MLRVLSRTRGRRSATWALAALLFTFLAAPTAATGQADDEALPEGQPQELLDAIEVAQRHLEEEPERAGGTWIEPRVPASASRLHVAVTDDAARSEAALQGSVGRVPFVVHTVRFNEAELTTFADQIFNELSAHPRMDQVATWPDAPTNQVVVQVPNSDARAVVKEVIDNLPIPTAAVTVHVRDAQRQLAASRDNDGPPIKAGVRLLGTLPDDLGRVPTCTSGFSARRDVMIGGMFPAPRHFVLFAGHCTDSPQGQQNVWTHAARWEGVLVGRQFEGNVDAALLEADPASVSTDIYITDGGGTQSVTAVQDRQDAIVGLVVCHSGVTSGFNCAEITRTGVSVNLDGVVLTDMIEFPGNCDLGDSGGPVFQPHGDEATAAGITSYKGSGGICGFGHIEHASQELDFVVLTA